MKSRFVEVGEEREGTKRTLVYELQGCVRTHEEWRARYRWELGESVRGGSVDGREWKTRKVDMDAQGDDPILTTL